MSAEEYEEQVKTLLSTDLGGYIGPIVLAWAADFAMYGIIFGQFCFWLSTSRTDRLFIKLIVTWIFLLCGVTTFFGLYLFFWHFALHFGTFSVFTKLNRLGWYTLLDIAVTVPVLIFYIERAYRLHKKQIWVPILVAPLLVLSIVGAIGSKVLANDETARVGKEWGQPEDMAHYLKLSEIYFYLWLGGLLVADVLVTAIILWGLNKNRSGWSTTDKLIYRLIWVTAEAQFPGTIIAIINVALASTLSNSPLNVFFQVVHPKIYAISLFAVLNSRVSIRRGLDSTQMYGPKVQSGAPTSDPDRPWLRTRDENDPEVATQPGLERDIPLEAIHSRKSLESPESLEGGRRTSYLGDVRGGTVDR